MIRYSVLALGLVFACGGVDNGELFDDSPDGGEEIGSVEQAITGKVTPSFQFGASTATNRRKCNKTTAGQVCEVPNTVNLLVCTTPRVGSALGGTAQTAGNDAVNELHGISGFALNFPGASLGVLDGLCDFTDNQPEVGGGTDANIVISKGAVGSSGTASNDIADYASVTFFQGTGSANLVEGAGVVGSYKSHQMCSIVIDVVDLQNKGTSATQDYNLVFHAVANSLLVCGGVARHPTATGTSSLYSRAVMNGAIDVAGISAGEFCQVNGLTLSAPTQYNNNATTCPSD